MVYFSTSHTQCFCTTLQNRQTKMSSFYSMSYYYFIKNSKKHIVHA